MLDLTLCESRLDSARWISVGGWWLKNVYISRKEEPLTWDSLGHYDLSVLNGKVNESDKENFREIFWKVNECNEIKKK